MTNEICVGHQLCSDCEKAAKKFVRVSVGAIVFFVCTECAENRAILEAVANADLDPDGTEDEEW